MNSELAEAMTEIQTAHRQIDQWNFGIPDKDAIDGHELSLSECIASLCLRLEQAERERDEAVAEVERLQEQLDALMKASEIAAGNPRA